MAFDYPTNFSNGTAVEGLGTFLKYAHYTTAGLMGYGFLIIIFIMSFVVGIMFGTKKALLSSSFITFIFSVYFWRLELINPTVIFALVVIMIISAIGSKSEGGGP